MIRKIHTRALIRAAALCGLLAASCVMATPAALVLRSDASGRNPTFLRPVPAHVDVRVLGANTAESASVPGGARFVIVSANCAELWVKTDGTAAIPAADVTDGSAAELNPSGYYVEGAVSLSVISPTGCTVSLGWYQ